MEFDIRNDEDVYSESFIKARQDILQGADIHKDWNDLQTRHAFLKDIVQMSQKQAQTLSSVFAAAEFFLSRLLDDCCARHRNGFAASFVDSAKVNEWRDVFCVFMSLYDFSPAPSRRQFFAEVQKNGLRPFAEENECGGAEMARDAKDNRNSFSEEKDDGSFVDLQLKKMLKQCVALGRKWCAQMISAEKGEKVEKMRLAFDVMNSFVNPQTLEW